MSKFRLSLDFLPDRLLNFMSGAEIRITRQLFRLINIRGEVISYEYANVTPTLKYLAESTSSSITAVSRTIKSLCDRGIIEVKHSRKSNGEYAINSYTIGKEVRALYKKFMNKVKGIKNHHFQFSQEYLSKDNNKDNYLTHFLSDLKKMLPSIGSIKKKDLCFL